MRRRQGPCNTQGQGPCNTHQADADVFSCRRRHAAVLSPHARGRKRLLQPGAEERKPVGDASLHVEAPGQWQACNRHVRLYSLSACSPSLTQRCLLLLLPPPAASRLLQALPVPRGRARAPADGAADDADRHVLPRLQLGQQAPQPRRVAHVCQAARALRGAQVVRVAVQHGRVRACDAVRRCCRAGAGREAPHVVLQQLLLGSCCWLRQRRGGGSGGDGDATAAVRGRRRRQQQQRQEPQAMALPLLLCVVWLARHAALVAWWAVPGKCCSVHGELSLPHAGEHWFQQLCCSRRFCPAGASCVGACRKLFFLCWVTAGAMAALSGQPHPVGPQQCKNEGPAAAAALRRLPQPLGSCGSPAAGCAVQQRAGGARSRAMRVLCRMRRQRRCSSTGAAAAVPLLAACDAAQHCCSRRNP